MKSVLIQETGMRPLNQVRFCLLELKVMCDAVSEG